MTSVMDCTAIRYLYISSCADRVTEPNEINNYSIAEPLLSVGSCFFFKKGRQLISKNLKSQTPSIWANRQLI